EVVVGDHRRNRHRQPRHRRHERLRDAGRDRSDVRAAAVRHPDERVHDADHRAQQSQQRRDRRDDRQPRQPRRELVPLLRRPLLRLRGRAWSCVSVSPGPCTPPRAPPDSNSLKNESPLRNTRVYGDSGSRSTDREMSSRRCSRSVERTNAIPCPRTRRNWPSFQKMITQLTSEKNAVTPSTIWPERLPPSTRSHASSRDASWSNAADITGRSLLPQCTRTSAPDLRPARPAVSNPEPATGWGPGTSAAAHPVAPARTGPAPPDRPPPSAAAPARSRSSRSPSPR